MKKTLAFASMVLMATSLTACGSDDGGGGGGGSSSGDYCSQLKDAKASFDNLNLTGLDDAQFSNLQDTFSDLGDSAPSDVKDDWDTMSSAIDDFKGLLDDAGISFDDLAAISKDPSNLPDGIDLAKLQELAPKLEKFGEDSGIEKAGDAITANAKSECDIDLDASTDAPAS